MKKQKVNEMIDNVKQIKACSIGDEIIDEINRIFHDKFLSVDEKVFRITRTMNDFKLTQRRIIDDVVDVRYQGEVHPFPRWKIEDLLTCCETTLDALRNPPPKKHTNRVYGVAIILARNDKFIPSNRWVQKDLREISKRIFNDIGNPHHAVRIALDFEKKLDEIKLHHPEDHENGVKLYDAHREDFSQLFPSN